MSILIKGVEIPKSCAKCKLFGECGCPFIGAVGYVLTRGERSEDCPLVPAPPHGRLIDADALADVFHGFIAMYDSCPFSQLSLSDRARRDELQSALAEVLNAPTIIEAEEEGKK